MLPTRILDWIIIGSVPAEVWVVAGKRHFTSICQIAVSVTTTVLLRLKTAEVQTDHPSFQSKDAYKVLQLHLQASSSAHLRSALASICRQRSRSARNARLHSMPNSCCGSRTKSSPTKHVSRAAVYRASPETGPFRSKDDKCSFLVEPRALQGCLKLQLQVQHGGSSP